MSQEQRGRYSLLREIKKLKREIKRLTELISDKDLTIQRLLDRMKKED